MHTEATWPKVKCLTTNSSIRTAKYLLKYSIELGTTREPAVDFEHRLWTQDVVVDIVEEGGRESIEFEDQWMEAIDV